MGVIIISFFIKAADADPPAAVAVPSQTFHIAGFHSDNRRTDLSHHIVPKVLPAVTEGTGRAKVVIVRVRKPFFFRLECF